MDDLTSFGDVMTPMSNNYDIDFVSEFEGDINTPRNNQFSINDDDVDDNKTSKKNSLIIYYDSKG